MLPIKIMIQINFLQNTQNRKLCYSATFSEHIYQKRHFLVDFLNFQNDTNSRSLAMPKQSNCQAQRSHET